MRQASTPDARRAMEQSLERIVDGAERLRIFRNHADVHASYARLCDDINRVVPARSARLSLAQRQAMSLLFALAVPPCADAKGALVPKMTWSGLVAQETDGMWSLRGDTANVRIEVDEEGCVRGGTNGHAMLDLRRISPILWVRSVIGAWLHPMWSGFWKAVDRAAVWAGILDSRGDGQQPADLAPLRAFLDTSPTYCNVHGLKLSRMVRTAPDGLRGRDVELRYIGGTPGADGVIRFRVDLAERLPDGGSLDIIGDYLERRYPHCCETAGRMADGFLA
jgi:hypothetical protein